MCDGLVVVEKYSMCDDVCMCDGLVEVEKYSLCDDGMCDGVVEVEKYSMCDDESVMVWLKLRNIEYVGVCDDFCDCGVSSGGRGSGKLGFW